MKIDFNKKEKYKIVFEYTSNSTILDCCAFISYKIKGEKEEKKEMIYFGNTQGKSKLLRLTNIERKNETIEKEKIRIKKNERTFDVFDLNFIPNIEIIRIKFYINLYPYSYGKKRKINYYSVEKIHFFIKENNKKIIFETFFSPKEYLNQNKNKFNSNMIEAYEINNINKEFILKEIINFDEIMIENVRRKEYGEKLLLKTKIDEDD